MNRQAKSTTSGICRGKGRWGGGGVGGGIEGDVTMVHDRIVTIDGGDDGKPPLLASRHPEAFLVQFL